MARRPRHLSPDEAELWSRVARTAVPLNPERQGPADVEPGPQVVRPKAKSPEPTQPAPIQPFRIGQTAAPRQSVAATPATDPPRIDKRTFKRMQRGKLQPEARIDLHGMTLVQAHPALIGFILSSQAAGRRLVLVITGKGRDRDAPGPIPERRGVLRQQVPLWLRGASLGPIVLEVRQAHQSHGGAGAFYVYLRRGR